MRILSRTTKRLERLELYLSIGRPIGLWPKMMKHGEWEALALPMQQELSTDSKIDYKLPKTM